MLFAIGDLHLGSVLDKSMDIFGDEWAGHMEKIRKNWLITVSPEDTVILCGDTSWAMRMEEFMPDFEYLRKLPGKKILLPGNHDFWWGSTNALNTMDKNIFFMKNNYFPYGDYHLCGARGWLCPNEAGFTKQDEKIYKREAARLKLSLDGAMKNGAKKIICAFHFPPVSPPSETSLYTELLEAYPVEKVVYGHLHGKPGFAKKLKSRPGLAYTLVSADYTGFAPVKILEY